MGVLRGLAATCFAAACLSCSFIQPSSRGAPIADTVGAGLFAAGGIGVASTLATEDVRKDSDKRDTATAGAITLGSIALIYAVSALYGFTRDKRHQSWDEPILGLQILALGLAGFGAGAAAASGNHQGCCSYHGGITDSCSSGRVICEDGSLSPSCECE